MLKIQARWGDASGFTLMELMIVVVIIGILAAIAVPNFVRFRDNAREARVKSSCHTVQMAVESFAVQNEGFYPQTLLVPSSLGQTVVDLLPGGVLLENSWNGVRSEPRDGVASQPGEVGFGSVVNAGTVTGYTIEGYGANAIVITMQNGS